MSTLPDNDETKDEKVKVLTQEEMDQEIKNTIQQVCGIHTIQPPYETN